MFFQLPTETQILAKQMSLAILQIAFLPTNLHQSAVVNLECRLQFDPAQMPLLLHDLVEVFSESIGHLLDQGINIVKL